MLHSGKKRSHNLAVAVDGSYLATPEQPVHKQEVKMKTESKVISLRVFFESEPSIIYVMVKTNDMQKANQIAKEWAEKKIGKNAAKVETNKGILDIPQMEAHDEYQGFQIWELPF
jgi:hypothetical protein